MGNEAANQSGLETRFVGLMERLDLARHADDVFQILARYYSEPGRHYHTLAHIRACLDRLDEVRHRLRDADAAELALWFHDAVYDPSRDDNELRSAFLFDRQLGIHMPTQRADDVHAMIMATTHDGAAGMDEDACYVADIDLSGLAAARPEFLRATEQLRRECGDSTNSGVSPGSWRFLEKLLSRPGIYLTGYFQARCEQQARRNVEGLLAGDFR